MGYTTEFKGEFDITPPLAPDDQEFLTKLAETRRMKRNLGPEYGVEGEFYVGGTGCGGQDRDPSIVDFNAPPRTQPGLWCKWSPSGDGSHLRWDGREKFTNYVAWLEYLIAWLKPKGYVVSGEVEWQGEAGPDFGTICVVNNRVGALRGRSVRE